MRCLFGEDVMLQLSAAPTKRVAYTHRSHATELPVVATIQHGMPGPQLLGLIEGPDVLGCGHALWWWWWSPGPQIDAPSPA